MKVRSGFAVCAVAACVALPLWAEIKMGAPFSEGAVLQRGMKVPVWGTVSPDPARTARFVKVEFAGQKKLSAVDAKTGAWKVEFDPMQASKTGRSIKVSDMDKGLLSSKAVETLEIKDVLVGEVWFASGQSNMECPIWGDRTRYRDGKGGLMTQMTRLPYVRYVKTPKKWSVERTALAAKWRRFTPEDLQLFHRENLKGGSPTQLSALAFYYARELYLALDVPVGIIDSSWGGTNIDAWTPRSGYTGCDKSIQPVADYPVKAKWHPRKHAKWCITRDCQQPTVLFNGMVADYAPMAMRGFIWYQGCHNGTEPQLYCAKLHALYEGWRREFANPDLKFYLVQLAPFRTNWMGICAAQSKFVAEEKNAAIAVTADVGNFDDIHPNDKEVVAKRLAVHALKRDYGFNIAEDDSPVLKSASFKDGKAFLVFDNVKDWYVYAPDYSRAAAFEVAGADGVWHAAAICNYRNKDYVDGATIILASDKVPAPVKARYMGKNRTFGTMYNEASLPLGPFETK